MGWCKGLENELGVQCCLAMNHHLTGQVHRLLGVFEIMHLALYVSLLEHVLA